MKYGPDHAARALEIMERLSPLVSQRSEYQELIAILHDAQRWKEAHELFTKIRVNITLPSESHKKQDLDAYFVYVAENAAKTAYNCSGCSAPFDEDSYEWLLKCERQFTQKLNETPS
jgi:DNA-directed RNA polymerase subunit RPC12/RpoP